jgi:hypothetical protein
MTPEEFKKHFNIPRKGQPDCVQDIKKRIDFSVDVTKKLIEDGIESKPKLVAVPVCQSDAREPRPPPRQESSRNSPHVLPDGDSNVNASANPAPEISNDLDSDAQQSLASHTNISSTLPNSNYASPSHTSIKASSTVLQRVASDSELIMSAHTPHRGEDGAREVDSPDFQTPAAGRGASGPSTPQARHLTHYPTLIVPATFPGHAFRPGHGQYQGMLSPNAIPSPYQPSQALIPGNPVFVYDTAPPAYYIPTPTYRRATDVPIGFQPTNQAMNSNNWRATMDTRNARGYTTPSPPNYDSSASDSHRLSAAVSSGWSNNYYSRGGAVPTSSAFGFEGYLPSSLDDLESMGLRYAVDNQLIANEAVRGKYLNLQSSNFADGT